MSSPRSRSTSCLQEISQSMEIQMMQTLPPNAGHNLMQHGQQTQMLQMPYYPLGFIPMPMHMPEIPQMMYDPTINIAYNPPPLTLSPEQQQRLIHHQQGMMMMPFSPMYMMPHPQFEPPMNNNHMMNLNDEQNQYNIRQSQMYFESQMHQHNMNMPPPSPVRIMPAENDIVDAVRTQM